MIPTWNIRGRRVPSAPNFGLTALVRTRGDPVRKDRQIYCDDGTCPAAASCVRYWRRRTSDATTCEERPHKIKLIKYPRDPTLDYCLAYVSWKQEIFREEIGGPEMRTRTDRVPESGVSGGGSPRSPASAGLASWQLPEG
jgi:hypothetical protein